MASQAPSRVIAYIDGFNLYYGLMSKGWRRYLWLDLNQLIASLLRPYQELSGVKYCTARISAPPGYVQRQTTYIEALAAIGVRIIEGKFQPRDGRCLRCGHTWATFEEKQTDVNLAVEMIRDAHLDLFDTAMLVSGDLTPAGRRGPTTLRRDGGPFVSTRRQAEHAAVGYGSAGPTDPQPFRILHRSSSQARS